MRPLPVPAPAMSAARMSAATSGDGNAEVPPQTSALSALHGGKFIFGGGDGSRERVDRERRSTVSAKSMRKFGVLSMQNEGVEEAQARVSMGDEEQPLETEQERESDNETHERLLTLAARKGAKLAALLRKIHSSSVSRQFPLPETPGHPSADSVLAVGGGRGANVERAGAVGEEERNSGRLRDAVCEAAAKGLNLFISGATPSMSADGSRGDGTPKSSVSGASTSPEGLASVPSSGPGSSPASTTDALEDERLLSPSAETEVEHNGCFTEAAPQSVTPGRQSHPTADETWSQILKPVTTRLEAKVSSMREGAMTDLNRMLHAFPEGSQARQSANSVLDMLGESANKAVRRRQTVVTSEGHVYEGFVNDDGHVLRHGYGRLTWPDGHWFQGEFRGGETSGLGRRAWPTGHAFSGMLSICDLQRDLVWPCLALKFTRIAPLMVAWQEWRTRAPSMGWVCTRGPTLGGTRESLDLTSKMAWALCAGPMVGVTSASGSRCACGYDACVCANSEFENVCAFYT